MRVAAATEGQHHYQSAPEGAPSSPVNGPSLADERREELNDHAARPPDEAADPRPTGRETVVRARHRRKRRARPVEPRLELRRDEQSGAARALVQRSLLVAMRRERRRAAIGTGQRGLVAHCRKPTVPRIEARLATARHGVAGEFAVAEPQRLASRTAPKRDAARWRLANERCAIARTGGARPIEERTHRQRSQMEITPPKSAAQVGTSRGGSMGDDARGGGGTGRSRDCCN